MTANSTLYYSSRDYYSRPYRIPVPIGSTQKIDPREMLGEDIPEGCITEYIAYRQGLPVTEAMVQQYIQQMGLNEIIENVKSLGDVVFSCTDEMYYTEYDLSTLSRHFDLIDNIREHTTQEKDENDNHVIPIDFSSEEMIRALSGILYSPSRLSSSTACLPYRCLQFLRPCDTAYYMRYRWEMGEKGLLTTTGELNKEETLSFLREVSYGLDDATRAHLSTYTRIASSSVIGPLITHIVSGEKYDTSPGALQLLRLLLADKSSIYLAVLCKIPLDYEALLAEVSNIQLDDAAEGLTDNDWHNIQSRLLALLHHIPNWKLYLRVMAILGWSDYFPAPDNFIFPMLDQVRPITGELHLLDWMDETMKNHVYRADRGVRMPLESVE